MASGLENIETIESPFRRFVTTIGVFPTAFTDAMTYYECLAYLVKYLEDTIIPAVNENAEALSELQKYYVQLKSYVDNYFANLDVQEEINNKLDEMVESGELQRIINSPATRENLGGVKIGEGLDITEDGELSAKPNFIVTRINTNNNNTMFPDVEKFGNKYYMVMRGGSLHASFDGKIYLSESSNGNDWSTPDVILEETGVDYRDPFLSVIDGVMYLSTFTRVDNGDSTVTLTGYIYELNPETLEKTLVRTLNGEALFGKIIKDNTDFIFGSYNDSASYLYKGGSIAGAGKNQTLSDCYELSIRFINGVYYLLSRTSTGMTLKKSSNFSTWTSVTIPQMTSADSMTKISDKILVGYRDSIIDKHEYGNFAIAKFDSDFNLLETYKVFASQTQDCGYSSIYFDESNDKVLITSYVQDGSSKTSVYNIECNEKDITNLNIFQNKFDLDNCLKPATLTNERDYASVIELINKETHGKFINMLDGNGDIKGQLYKDPNSAILYLENPTGGIFIKSSANTSMGVGTYNNIELQGTGNVLMRQGLEVRGTANAQNLKVRALNNSSSPYADVVKMTSGAYTSIPAVSAVPTGYMYWDTTNARLLVNAGGAWKQVTLTSI